MICVAFIFSVLFPMLPLVGEYRFIKVSLFISLLLTEAYFLRVAFKAVPEDSSHASSSSSIFLVEQDYSIMYKYCIIFMPVP